MTSHMKYHDFWDGFSDTTEHLLDIYAAHAVHVYSLTTFVCPSSACTNFSSGALPSLVSGRGAAPPSVAFSTAR